MNKPLTDEELANLSDEEFLAMGEPEFVNPEPAEVQGDEGAAEVTEVVEEAAAVSEESTDESEAPIEAAAELPAADADASDILAQPDDYEPAAPEAKTPAAPLEESDAEASAPAEKPEAEAPKAEEPKTSSITNEEKISAYDKIMAPFKANGRDFQAQSPEEAVQLMQMGANYTKKLMELQPRLKLVKMLENQGLLDENKLSFLIDLSKKDPAAIQKYLKDSNIDPLDIDTSSAPEYQPKSYSVSDAEMNFSTALDELVALPEGKETLSVIDRTWDKSSKDQLWQNPNLLGLFREHRVSKVYDTIVAEMDRQRTLGIGLGETFLQAYKRVGDDLQNRGLLTSTAQPAPQTQGTPVTPAQPQEAPVEQPRVVAQRPAPVKPAPAADKVRAASSTPSTPQKAQSVPNFLAMSDEEFEKASAFAGRV